METKFDLRAGLSLTSMKVIYNVKLLGTMLMLWKVETVYTMLSVYKLPVPI